MTGSMPHGALDTADLVSTRIVHPWPIRVMHWLNAVAMVIMIMSGWRIYDASPFLGFLIPPQLTLGGWLAGAIAWHLAAMWLLVANGIAYLAYGLATGYFRRRLLPITAAGFVRDFGQALRFRLDHQVGSYNVVQRAAYVAALALGLLAVLSGLAVWKPVQLQELAALMGGYEGARRVHFFAMSGIVLFLAVHLALVALVPKTLLPMLTGRIKETGR